MKEHTEAVLNHLLFHKALVSETNGGERITRYVQMLDDIDRGMYIAVQDPMEKAIAAAFELVMEHEYDPWDIDLVEFCRMYLKKLKADDAVNFVTAGRLVFMAWEILRLQSEEVLGEARPPPAPEDLFFSDWDVSFATYDEPEDVDFTQSVLADPEPPLRPVIRHPGMRSVTLLELVDAFDDARKEAELRQHIQALREDAARRRPKPIHDKVHREDLTEDIGLTWHRLAQYDGTAIPLRKLHNGDVWDRVTVFISVLFLAAMAKVRLWQRNFPRGDIMVKRLAPADDVDAEAIEEELAEDELVVAT